MSWLLAALLIPLCAQGRSLSQASPPQMATNCDVLVIGAGMAGVTAAANLTAAGANVIVLEARDRSGGRTWSVAAAGGKVDMGAMWIHDGFPGNPLYDLASKLNAPLSPEQDYFSGIRFMPDGGPEQPSNVTREVGDAFLDDVLGQINTMRGNATAVDVPVSALYDAMLASHPQWTLEHVWEANLNMHAQFQVLLNANATKLSALRYGDAKTLPGIDVLLKDGFDSLVKAQMHGLDVRYSTPVVAVTQSPGGVEVTTANGTTYTARYVITTQSLGLLKEGKVAFTPSLPAEKLQAISQMGFGVLDKTILVFDKLFWNSTDFISRNMVDRSGMWSVFLNYNKTLGLPVLVALNPADTARQLESMTDDEVVASLMAVLRRMYGAAIPQPRQAFVTRWASDPWARGSYSFFATGNAKSITDVLAEPVGRLLFAGEAASENPGTVLGAYKSGLREGLRAAQLLSAPPVPSQAVAGR